MLINRNNYETFIIDYFDGKLDPVLAGELLFFLSQNPDIEEEFNAYENIKLPADKLYFNQKESLKKSYTDITAITEVNFDEFSIAAVEGDLDEESKARYLKYLENNPGKKKDFNLYKKTILKPDMNLVFHHAGKLKKHKIISLKFSKPAFYAGISAAAVLAVVLTLFFNKTSVPDTISEKSSEMKDIDRRTEISRKAAVENMAQAGQMKSGKMHTDRTEHKIPSLIYNNNLAVRKSENLQATQLQKMKSIEVQEIENKYLKENQALINKDDLSASQNISSQDNKEKSLAEYIRENFLKKEISKSIGDLNVWEIAQVSIKGINYLTESDVQIDKKLDKSGKISEFAIESESFSFSTFVKKHPAR